MIKSLDEIPVIADYLKRIGATPVNFKRADVIKTVQGYPKAVGRVHFSTFGVSVTGEAEAPTEEEQEAITEAMQTAELPKMTSMVAMSSGPPGVRLTDPNTFICHNLKGEVVMVHERYQTKDGGKGFIPWTKWSDGEWRKMEPEVMPFYGIPGHENKTTLYIHEGAKAAKRIQRMIAGEIPSDGFPWFEQMRWGHHIGWIGGVWAVGRSDWHGLAKMGWRKVVIISDNDPEGRAIVPQIAQHFNCVVHTLQFDGRWPEHFDLGDDWPEELFGDEGQYIGAPYEHCLQPATWATNEFEIVGARGGVTLAHEIRPIFAEQWAWIEEQDLMVNLDMPHYRMAAGKFNGFVRPFSHVRNTLELFQRQYTGNQMKLTYDPSQTSIIIRESNGLQAINQYQGSNITAIPGDWQPWIEFLEYLFPVEEDRNEIKRWVATLRARPGIRMIYGLLLMSERQGTGKGTFSRVLADLVGLHNASFPSENLIVGSDFNGWAAAKRLIIVDEIYAGHSWKAYNALKPYVTDATIEINVKFEKTWTMPNWTHYILMSNSRIALKLEQGDRRWLVPKVTEDAWPVERFRAFHQWIRHGGLNAIAYWAESFEDRGEGHYVQPGEIAPTSTTKDTLIGESKSDAEIILEQLVEEINEFEGDVAVPLTGMKKWLGQRTGGNVYESPPEIARIITRLGMHTTDRIKVGSGKVQLIVKNEAMLEWENGRLRDIIQTPDQLLPPEL